jgi:hypothetical protein
VTRDQLVEFIQQDIGCIIQKFHSKNKTYGNDRDGFYNFRETARRLYGQEPTMEQTFGVLLTLTDKHWVALMQGGSRTDEAADRLLDIIIYALIGRAMIAQICKDSVSEEAEHWSLEELAR